MNPKKITFSMILLLALVVVSGCGRSVPNPGTLPSPTPTPLASTSTLAYTTTPNPTDTPTSIPTLTTKQAGSQLLELLGRNGGCHLPCLWGITPGKSVYQEAFTVLTPLGSISKLTDLFPSPGAINPRYDEGDMSLVTNLDFAYSNDGIVNSIYFQAREFERGNPDDASALKIIFDSPIFGERLRPYMLPNILTEHGIPKTVLILTDGGPELGKNIPGFYILLFYPDQGILVKYTTSRQVVDGKVLGCLANAQVELDLYPAGDADLFSEHISQSRWSSLWPELPADSPGWKTIEEATSMTLEQFYEAFKEPSDRCIEAPVDLWPESW